MRNVLFFLAFWVFSSINAQSCLPGGITFTTQSEVDQFKISNPGCTTIEGSVYLMNGPIIHLDSLNEIEQINGDLIITNNNALNSLLGFQSLRSVGQNMRIQSNAVLTNLAGLDQLSAVLGDFFYIGENPALSTLEHLSDLDSINGIFQIWGNDALVHLNGIEALKSVKGNLAIFENDQLLSLNGMQQLSGIGGDLRIENNPSLVNIQGLDHPVVIGGALVITGNGQLSECNARAICEYISMPASFMAISNNAVNCNSVGEVSAVCLSGAFDPAAFSVEIWPNPGSGLFYLSLPEIEEIVSIQVVGMLGALCLEGFAQFPVLDLRAQPAGVYQLKIHTKNGYTLTTRIAKI